MNRKTEHSAGPVEFGKVLETTPARIFVWDREGAIVFANREAAKLLGRAPEDVIGTTVAELARKHDLFCAVERPSARVLASAAAISGESRVTTGGSHAVLHYDLRPLEVRDDEVTAVLCTVTDITDLRSAQEAERRVRRQLQDALTRVLSGFVRVCSECYAVSSNGEWVPLERYLEQTDAVSLTHGYCDACYHRALAELKEV
jgi:PAS domain S-box-containing protein